MKTLLTIFVLFFSSLVFAEDISEFQIEGISIGESALDYYSEKEIINNKMTNYPQGKFYVSFFSDSNFKNYEVIEIYFRKNDKNFKIYAIKGGIYFSNNNIEKCIDQKKDIVEDIENIFNITFFTGSQKHEFDTTGKSINYQSYYVFDDRSNIRVECYDWSTNIENEYGWGDNLSVALISSDVQEWIDNGYD